MWFRLVERDRRVLTLLADHRVVTTEQIAAVEFTSTRRAQDRLRILRQLGVLFAFRDSFAGGGTSPNRYALGYLGARLIAAQREQTPPTPAAHRLALERLAASPRLGHLLGVNQFFCDLIAYARYAASRTTEGAETEPTAPSGLTAPTEWLPERMATVKAGGQYSRCTAHGTADVPSTGAGFPASTPLRTRSSIR